VDLPVSVEGFELGEALSAQSQLVEQHPKLGAELGGQPCLAARAAIRAQ
jgi:hypothetical protein